jgi:hypothetical protein
MNQQFLEEELINIIHEEIDMVFSETLGSMKKYTKEDAAEWWKLTTDYVKENFPFGSEEWFENLSRWTDILELRQEGTLRTVTEEDKSFIMTDLDFQQNLYDKLIEEY